MHKSTRGLLDIKFPLQLRLIRGFACRPGAIVPFEDRSVFPLLLCTFLADCWSVPRRNARVCRSADALASLDVGRFSGMQQRRGSIIKSSSCQIGSEPILARQRRRMARRHSRLGRKGPRNPCIYPFASRKAFGVSSLAITTCRGTAIQQIDFYAGCNLEVVWWRPLHSGGTRLVYDATTYELVGASISSDIGYACGEGRALGFQAGITPPSDCAISATQVLCRDAG